MNKIFGTMSIEQQERYNYLREKQVNDRIIKYAVNAKKKQKT